MKNILLFPILFLTAATFLPAQSTTPCSTPENRQFDFWIGDWEVWSGDSVVGYNRVELILGQCVIMENWRGKGGSVGKSFNLYNAQTREWEQTWVDNFGSSIFFHGHFQDGVMALKGEGIARDGKPVIYKLTFFDNPDGSVRQLWEASKTGGESWTVLFDGLYKQKTGKG